MESGGLPVRTLRVLHQFDEPEDGATNMQRDRDLLTGATSGSPPTLRLYRWSRPTLSLGHTQTLESAADPHALARLDIPWVRRPTGGRALLHLPDELTYAFAAERGVAPGVRAAYGRVMRAIREALVHFFPLDAPAGDTAARRAALSRLPCHAVATGHEISSRGRKLVAGAQRWRRGAFLQHGSIPWTLDRILTNRAVGLPADAPTRAVGLVELAGGPPAKPPPGVKAVAAALCVSFAREFETAPRRSERNLVEESSGTRPEAAC